MELGIFSAKKHLSRVRESKECMDKPEQKKIHSVFFRKSIKEDEDCVLMECKFNPDSQVIVSKWLQDEPVRRGCLCPVDDLPM